MIILFFLETHIIDLNSAILPVMHIKLGVVRNILEKICEENDEVFNYLQRKEYIASNIKNHQYSKLVYDPEFDNALRSIRGNADLWQSMSNVASGFLQHDFSGRAANLNELLETLMKELKENHITISQKIHMLNCHRERFRKNDFSDQHAEWAHMDLKEFYPGYRRNNGNNIANLIPEYIPFKIAKRNLGV